MSVPATISARHGHLTPGLWPTCPIQPSCLSVLLGDPMGLFWALNLGIKPSRSQLLPQRVGAIPCHVYPSGSLRSALGWNQGYATDLCPCYCRHPGPGVLRARGPSCWSTVTETHPGCPRRTVVMKRSTASKVPGGLYWGMVGTWCPVPGRAEGEAGYT